MNQAIRLGGWRLQFLILSATWGSSFLFIKVMGKRWPALWVSFGRVTLGALALVALMLWRRERFGFERRLWLQLTGGAVFFNVIPFTLYAYGEKHVTSIVAGLWNATTPLWVLTVVLIAFPEQKPGRDRVLGLGVGFLGVAFLLGPWRGLGHGQLLGHLACAGAAASYGVGFPYVRRYLASRAESGIALSAGQLLCATGLLAVLAPFAGLPSTDIGLDGLGSIVALGVLGSGVAYALNYSIVRAAGSTVASTVTYLIPVWATVLGLVVLGETLSWNQPIGAVVLLAGVAITQGLVRSAGA